MLGQLKDLIAGKPAGVPRSPKWPAVEKAHLAKQPVCQVCGGKQQLNAHHKRPFHLFPELELDDANLVTLCNAKRCHITFGHGGDFQAYNAMVDIDVPRANVMYGSRRYK